MEDALNNSIIYSVSDSILMFTSELQSNRAISVSRGLTLQGEFEEAHGQVSILIIMVLGIDPRTLLSRYSQLLRPTTEW